MKNEQLHIRLSELEKQVIKDKAELFGLSLTEYIKYCCLFSSITGEFMEKLCAHNKNIVKTSL